MALQRRRWYRNLRELMKEPNAFDTLEDYEQFHRENPPSIFYKFFLFMFCLFFNRHFSERALQKQALFDMTAYAEDLEEQLARARSELKDFRHQAADQKKMRERYDELRRERHALKGFVVPRIDNNQGSV